MDSEGHRILMEETGEGIRAEENILKRDVEMWGYIGYFGEKSHLVWPEPRVCGMRQRRWRC